jgi:hypothetical protein
MPGKRARQAGVAMSWGWRIDNAPYFQDESLPNLALP